MFDRIFEGIKQAFKIASTITVLDVIDILILSFLIYFVYKFFKERRAGRLSIGIIFLVVVYIVASIFDFSAIKFVFQNLFQVGIISLVILFQPELRSGLEKIGEEPIRSFRGLNTRAIDAAKKTIVNVATAVADLSASQTGALIVFERSTKLGELILTGTVINADIDPFLIKNIFFNKAPLHDGAVIIRKNRLYSAGCLLPLSTNSNFIKDLGTRHRAAVGLSENSDAIVVVVSEETGTISVACDGKLYRGFDKERLINRLSAYLLPNKGGQTVTPPQDK